MALLRKPLALRPPSAFYPVQPGHAVNLQLPLSLVQSGRSREPRAPRRPCRRRGESVTSRKVAESCKGRPSLSLPSEAAMRRFWKSATARS